MGRKRFRSVADTISATRRPSTASGQVPATPLVPEKIYAGWGSAHPGPILPKGGLWSSSSLCGQITLKQQPVADKTATLEHVDSTVAGIVYAIGENTHSRSQAVKISISLLATLSSDPGIASNFTIMQCPTARDFYFGDPATAGTSIGHHGVKHVLQGKTKIDQNGLRIAEGGHARTPNVQISNATKPDKYGVYKAKIKIKSGNVFVEKESGTPVYKTNSNGAKVVDYFQSTMFPDTWSEKQILMEIDWIITTNNLDKIPSPNDIRKRKKGVFYASNGMPVFLIYGYDGAGQFYFVTAYPKK